MRTTKTKVKQHAIKGVETFTYATTGIKTSSELGFKIVKRDFKIYALPNLHEKNYWEKTKVSRFLQPKHL